MKPFTLNFREDRFNYEIAKISRCAGYIQHYIDQIKLINGLKFTPELFTDIVRGKGDKTDEAISDLTKQEMDKSGIYSQGLRDVAIKENRERFYEILNRLNSDHLITVEKYRLSVDEAGAVCLTNEEKEKIRKENTSEITTEKGMELYKAHKEMIEAINKFAGLLNGKTDVLKQSFLLPWNGSKEVTMVPLSYDMI